MDCLLLVSFNWIGSLDLFLFLFFVFVCFVLLCFFFVVVLFFF